MAFDMEELKRKMQAAKTGDELAALIMELPDRPLHEMSEEDREFFIMEQKIESELLTLTTKTGKTKDG
jgi:hypothetical protein